MNSLVDMALNAMPMGYYRDQLEPIGFSNGHTPTIKTPIPVESEGLCITTVPVKGTIQYIQRIYTTLPSGRVSKRVKVKKRFLKYKYQRSHSIEPVPLANGYCIECYDKKC